MRKARQAVLELAGREVVITNPDKPFFPEAGHTKLHLVRYYAAVGSLGIAQTANMKPERDAPSMFEPIHGSAFDITGKGIANPVATFWTAAMMLEHLGEKPAAERLMKAVEHVTADPSLHTPDLGGKTTTKQVTDAVCEALWQAND